MTAVHLLGWSLLLVSAIFLCVVSSSEDDAYPPGPIQISVYRLRSSKIKPLYNQTIGAIVGDSIGIIATAHPSGRPLPTYTWWLENGTRIPVSAGPSLNLSNVQENQSGRYICQAENAKGKVLANVSIEILKPGAGGPPPKTWANINIPNFELSCYVQGQDVNRIIWHKNGGSFNNQPGLYGTKKEILLDVDGQVIRIRQKLTFVGSDRIGSSQLRSEDAGIYSCHLQNKEKAYVFATELILSTSPIVAVIPNKTELIFGEHLRIACNVTSTLPFNVKWTKEDDGTLVSGNAVLELNSVTLSSAGRYYCQAFNTINNVRQNSSASFDLVVLQAPNNVQVNPPKQNPVTHAVGDQITLTCSASGLPSLQYTWTKLDSTNVLSSESRLIIPSAQKTDAGTYKCTVTNKLGENSDTSGPIEVIEPSFVPLPKAKQVSFDEANLTLFCSVQERSGSEIIWLKDGAQINSGDLYQIEVEDSGSPIHSLKSTLRFCGTKRTGESQIVPEDAGNYTCIFSNYPKYSSSMILTIDPVVMLTGNVAMESSLSSAIAILVAFIVAGCVLAAAVLIYFFVIRKKGQNKQLGPSYKTRPLNPQDLREQAKANV